MSSLIASLLLALLIVGGVAYVVVARYAGRGWSGDRAADAGPVLLVLFAVLAACLVGWIFAVAVGQVLAVALVPR